MKKDVMIISSSPRRHGNSDIPCDQSASGTGAWNIGEIKNSRAMGEAYAMGNNA